MKERGMGRNYVTTLYLSTKFSKIRDFKNFI